MLCSHQCIVVARKTVAPSAETGAIEVVVSGHRPFSSLLLSQALPTCTPTFPRQPSCMSAIRTLSEGTWMSPLSLFMVYTGWAPSRWGVSPASFGFVRPKPVFMRGELNPWSP